MATTEKYSRTAVTLHWLIALLIGINVVLGLAADSCPESWIRPLIDFHKSTGILVLGLALVRLGWRFGHKPPPMPVAYRVYERKMACVVHWGLYALMFLLPLSGWIHDSAWADAPSHPLKLYGIIPWFRFSFIADLDTGTREYVHKTFGLIHTYLSYALYGAVFVHVTGAFKHRFVEKENQRMRW
ncbi:MAG: cytochrome b [Alphaproteobacteria bacterium]